MLRHKLIIGARDFEIIAEHAVEADLQILDARALAFLLADLLDQAAAAILNAAQFIEILVKALADDTAVLDDCRRFFDDRTLNKICNAVQIGDLCIELLEQCGCGKRIQHLFELRQFLCGIRKGTQITGHRLFIDDPRHQSFKVIHPVEDVLQFHQLHAVLHEQVNGIKSCHDLRRTSQRTLQPCLEHTLAHRGARAFKHPEQRAFLLTRAHGADEFEIAHGVIVERHVGTAVAQFEVDKSADGHFLRGLDIVKHAADCRSFAAGFL